MCRTFGFSVSQPRLLLLRNSLASIDMATVYTAAGTGQPFLDLMPINTSLTEYHQATIVHTAPASPPVSPNSLARPPTPGFGPLSSHPPSPISIGSYFPSQATTHRAQGSPKSSSDSTSRKSSHYKADSALYLPISPVSQKCPSPSPPPPQLRRRDSAGVKRLLSLATLRKSFMGSTSSLSLSRSPTNGYENAYTTEPVNSRSRRPSSPSLSSTTSSTSMNTTPLPVIYTNISASQLSQPRTVPQPQPQPQPQLRKRKSASWFRRKSGLFMVDNDGSLQEQPARPSTAMGLERVLSPAPVLPAVDSLTGGVFANEDIFAPRS